MSSIDWDFAKTNGVFFDAGTLLQSHEVTARGLAKAASLASEIEQIEKVDPATFKSRIARLQRAQTIELSGLDLLNELVDDEPDVRSVETGVFELDTGGTKSSTAEIMTRLFSGAIDKRASDIHLDPDSEGAAVRFRVDGDLVSPGRIPRQLSNALVAKIKLLAGIDIGEKRLPQDGRISVRSAHANFDCRVSTLPNQFGERVVIRILKFANELPPLSDLGLPDDDLESLHAQLRAPNGLLLITGPTGSGKTTTLYSALREMNLDGRSALSIEDPVEMDIAKVGQAQVNHPIGFTFASALRSILRQDPDVIFVGEIRDTETARLAIQASLTGHLVLSTLHTKTGVGAINRLIDLGVEPYLVREALSMTIAQRLVKKPCQACVSQTHGVRQVPCGVCSSSGYLGRQAIGVLMNYESNRWNASDLGSINKLASTEKAKLEYTRSTLLERGLYDVDELAGVLGAF